MTGQLGERQASRPTVDTAVVDSPLGRGLLAVTAIAGGMAAAWLASGRSSLLAGMAVLLAAGNGYGKAYSP